NPGETPWVPGTFSPHAVICCLAPSPAEGEGKNRNPCDLVSLPVRHAGHVQDQVPRLLVQQPPVGLRLPVGERLAIQRRFPRGGLTSHNASIRSAAEQRRRHRHLRDLAATVYYHGTVCVLPNNGDGTGTFGTGQQFAVGGSPTALAGGDFNGDGKA